MPPSESAPTVPEEPGDLAEAGVYGTKQEGFEHGLVALALGEPYWLMPDGNRFRLLVSGKAVDGVRDELAVYDRESLAWPPAGFPLPRARAFELGTPVLWALAVTAVYCAQLARPFRLEDAGDLDTRAVFDGGQVWRILTSLFLHADVGHLSSNVVFGVLAFAAVLTTVGHWRGWLLILASSLTGNLTVAALYYPGPYASLGASTAIFAALGILTGRAVRAEVQSPGSRRWQSVFAPFAAGLTVLGVYGAGGMEVDVGAHAAGFAAGMVWGFFAGISDSREGIG
jgi:membrane associated rhomboid family serine protease